MALTRRQLIVGGGVLGIGIAAAGFGAVEARLVPGRRSLNTFLGWTGGPGVIPDVEPATLAQGSFVSHKRNGHSVAWQLASPIGSSLADVPLLISLHGRGGNAASSFGQELGLQFFLTDSVSRGNPPLAIASIDGGDTYWHPRASGEDAGGMVLDEFLPILSELGCNMSKIAFFGWSMGGFGALRLGQISPIPVAAVATSSAALWPRAADTPDGAFDDKADFEKYGLFPTVASMTSIPTRMACGLDDGFYTNNVSFAERLPGSPITDFRDGAHTLDFWRRVMPEQLDFVSKALAS